MAQRFPALNEELSDFIRQQKLYFVATAAEGYINLSPKGMDTLRILDNNTVAWLNVTGSGNETAAHVLEDGRMTMMFCAFEGRPLILRLYGQARVCHVHDADWQDLSANFVLLPGSRQIFVLTITLVQTSCGLGVPYFQYQGERGKLIDWATDRGPDGIREYWGRRNQLSLDGKPTGIFAESKEDLTQK